MTSVTAASGNRPRPAANPLISSSAPGRGCYTMGNSVSFQKAWRLSGTIHRFPSHQPADRDVEHKTAWSTRYDPRVFRAASALYRSQGQATDQVALDQHAKND